MRTTTPSLLGSLATAPLDTEAARSMLQRRLLPFTVVFAGLTCCFQAVGRVPWLRAPEMVRSIMGSQPIWM